jgi:hypothetical protein
MEMGRIIEKSSIDPASAHPMRVVTMQRNGWSERNGQFSGMGGHNAAESVDSLQRNEWSQCGGIRMPVLAKTLISFMYQIKITVQE